MLRSLEEILGYVLLAEDGDIGHVEDVLFDDHDWTVRYVVADTGKWISGRKVLIAPALVEDPDWPAKKLPVRLTREQIEGAPPADREEPVSRQHEKALAEYYRIPLWWESFGEPAPEEPLRESALEAAASGSGDPHLRSLGEVDGYSIVAEDGEVGHVEDLMVNDVEWTIRYLVVDTGGWLSGRKVLVSPTWLRELRWSEEEAVVDLTRDQIEASPELEPQEPIHRAYEAELHEGYGRAGYWES